MKLKLKHQAYQTLAVEAVLDCFQVQVKATGIRYRSEGMVIGGRIEGVQETLTARASGGSTKANRRNIVTPSRRASRGHPV